MFSAQNDVNPSEFELEFSNALAELSWRTSKINVKFT